MKRREFLKKTGLFVGSLAFGASMTKVVTQKKEHEGGIINKDGLVGVHLYNEKMTQKAESDIHQGERVQIHGESATQQWGKLTMTGIGIEDTKTGEHTLIHVFPRELRELTKEEMKNLPNMTLAEIANLK